MEFIKKEPFKDIYVHALVRDEKGQKMSKSKGNVIDPLELIEKYSADALRFTLLSMASPGRDLKLSEDRVKGYRNFLNKLWNANNFLIQNKCVFKNFKKYPKCKLNINVRHYHKKQEPVSCTVPKFGPGPKTSCLSLQAKLGELIRGFSGYTRGSKYHHKSLLVK